MAKELIVQEILDKGGREIGRLRGQRMPIGRECPDGITIATQGISRLHGLFTQAKNHWMYRDSGSTNGSWINGEKLEAEVPKIIRPGDTLQLGDAVLKIFEAPSPLTSTGQSAFAAKTPQSILVFAGGEILDEFPVPEFGKALVVGGAGGDLALEGDLEEQPSLIIEKRGEVICAYRRAKGGDVLINGAALSETTNLKDGDRVVIDRYTLILNDPPRGTRSSRNSGESAGSVPMGATQADPGRSGGWVDATDLQKSVVRTSFGRQNPDEIDSDPTVAINQEEFDTGSYERRSPMMRDDPYQYSGSYRGSPPLEDKLILVMGGMLLVGLVVVVIWWMFR